MSDLHLLKVWTCNRSTKKCITIADLNSPTLLNEVLARADQKLGIKGKRIVLECDGTEVDDELILKKFKDDRFIILEEDEEWLPPNSPTTPPVADTSQPLAQVDMNVDQNVQLIARNENGNIEVLREPIGAVERSQDSDDNQSENVENHQPTAVTDEPAQPVNPLVQQALEMRNISSWDDFVIHWESFSPNILKKLEHGDRDDTTINKCVEKVVEEMRYFTEELVQNDFVNVAKMMLATYPKTFEDRKPDGTRLGNGYNSLVKRLKNRNTHVTRFREKSLNQTLGIELRQVKAIEAIKSGCLQWQPNYPQGETAHSQEERRVRLLDFNNPTYLQKRIEDFTLSFAHQRLYLNNQKDKPEARNVVLRWPILKEPDFQLEHFKILTGVTLENILTRFLNDIDIVLEYGRKRKDPIVASDDNDPANRQVTVVKIIFAHFGEAFDLLIRENSDEADDIPKLDYPIILKSVGDNVKYSLLVDQTFINQTQDLLCALVLLITAYFVYNRSYPKHSACFLEFFQMRYLDIITDDQASRSRNARHRARAYTLYNKLNKLKRELDKAAEIS
ncbi:hypothetical protein QAD02_018244 [Eretmocerus hayati]|uniref:Uncharacterized protein n=1 Tax=Eretmocerus hayati TaxID=131215 RepID=A0ACC2PJ89_9HYME|nr:hypothetical protein QAD02_018244 [Eretmocerus hayati]